MLLSFPLHSQASPEDGLITLYTKEISHYTFIDILDEGCGVPAGLRKKIFQPWVKLTDANVPGVGLGLTICQSVVHEMGGDIMCRERGDGRDGTRISFCIPSIRGYEQCLPLAKRLLRSRDRVLEQAGAGGCMLGKKMMQKEQEVSKAARKREYSMQRESVFLRGKRYMSCKWAQLKNWSLSLKQRIEAEVQARLMAANHGQGLHSATALIFFLIALTWSFMYLIMARYSLFCVTLSAAGGYYAALRVGGLHSVFLISATTAGGIMMTSVILGCLSTSARVMMIIVPILSSILCPNSRVTFLTWMMTATPMCLLQLDFMLFDVQVERHIVLDILIDISFVGVVVLLANVFEKQWKVLETLREKFLCSMSQEIRTPLHGVMCAAEVILDRNTLPDRDIENVKTIIGSAQLLSSLASNLLDAGSRCHLQVDDQSVYHPGEVCAPTCWLHLFFYLRFLFLTPDLS